MEKEMNYGLCTHVCVCIFLQWLVKLTVPFNIRKLLLFLVRLYWGEQTRVVQSLNCIQLFATPWTAAHQASLSVTNSQILLKLMTIESVMPPLHLILCHPLLLLPSIFPSIRVFMSWLFTSGGQSIGASASVLPMNIQDQFSLGLTVLIFCQSKGLSRVFSNTTVQKHQFFSSQLPL